VIIFALKDKRDEWGLALDSCCCMCVCVFTGFVCFLLVTLFFGHTPVVGWFEDRAHEW